MTLEKKPVGGGRIREEEEDMINQLPDCLLCEILFNLPTKDVVKSSLLSRRWRDLWQSVLGLDLEFNGSTDFDKYGFFNRFIDVNSDVCLKRIKLQYVSYEDNAYNKTTIDTAIKQRIRHLDVGSRSHMVRIPRTIYTSCERLVSLKLYRASLPTPPKSVSLPCLKIMDLQQILVFDRLAMDMLISLCPALETLTVDMWYGDKVSSPSLLSFCLIKREYQIPQVSVMQLQTPRLKYLELYGHHIEKIIMNDLSSIVKLDLAGLISSYESYPNLLTLISCVRDLTISSDILAEFQDNHYGLNYFDVPQCVLSSLEFVEVRAKHKADMVKIGGYFMANSTALKKFTLRLDQIEEEEDYLFLDELFALPRKSMGCEVFVCCRDFITCKPFSLFTYADGFS